MPYWGKAALGNGWHPLWAHSLDVAAAGVVAVRRLPSLAGLLVTSTGLAPRHLPGWIGFWLGLHDLGKFAESFQSQRPDIFLALRGREPDPSRPYTLSHDSLGWLMWHDVVRPRLIEQAWFGAASEDLADGLDAWVRATTGHHGQPPQPGGHWQRHFHPLEDRAAALAHVDAMRAMFLDDDLVAAVAALDANRFLAASQALSWWIAGLAVLADWLGSNTRHFPYLDLNGQPAPTLAQYWETALRQAEEAIDASGVVPPIASAEMPFGTLFPGLDMPSPLQRWAADVPLAPGPQLHCLEDVTGAGKTEAALMLTHRLLAAGLADGFYVALPTMATANAMYARVAGVYARLFEGPASLVHATGQSRLLDTFMASVVEDLGAQVLPATQAEGDAAQQDETASARCAAWLADHRKRALLAPAGVGTIDQALLAVLQGKHQSLRLLGLQRKVLVVDEVHACDDYMLRVLGVLLQAHARGGGSAVLLSATLPLQARQALLAAFARGLGQRAPRADGAAYPLASSWPSPAAGADVTAQCAIETRPDVRRRVQVVQHERPADVLALIREALAAGQCVCWVRNTVADALDAYDQFAAELPPERLDLFHARFALHDRLAMEHRVLQSFGKDSGPLQRAGRLLVATQVVEQSLDVDFDLLVSDLAPVDRLVQRAGRLRRHRRRSDGTLQADPAASDARGEPVLHLLCPPWSDDPAADWFKTAFPKAAAVYPDHARLWLTMRALHGGGFTMPDDARPLIEGVFGDEAEAPPGLQANALAAEGQGWAARSQAQSNTIKLDQGYERGGIDWWSDAKTPSRLGEATGTVTLVRWDGQRLRPWVERAHGWAYSSVRMAERAIAAEAPPADAALAAALQALREELPAQGRWTVLLPLRETPAGWSGQALGGGERGRPGRQRSWRYDPRRGLQPCQPAGKAPAPDDGEPAEDPDA
ncbi:MAG: CRISPR-associated helicase Cas3' [Rubrivivax sp.]|nr:CRISPR-associated helicase Cas3' [Rubrivivax sp.]